MRECCRDLERITASSQRGGILPTGFVVSSVGLRPAGGKMELARETEAQDVAKTEEGGERMEKVDGKSGGGLRAL